jgi:hypothetical protein
MNTRLWWRTSLPRESDSERHELPLVLKRDATLRPMEIKEPPKKGADHIAGDIVPDRTEQYMDLVPKNTSPLKEKVTPPEGDIEARDK